jgi:hypothetical protein
MTPETSGVSISLILAVRSRHPVRTPPLERWGPSSCPRRLEWTDLDPTGSRVKVDDLWGNHARSFRRLLLLPAGFAARSTRTLT